MSTEPTEPAVISATVVCRTEGCENEGTSITFDVPEDVGAYVCGACGNPIEDVTS